MKTRTPLLIIYLATFGLVSGTALAEDKTGDVQVTGDVPADELTTTEIQPVEATAIDEAAAEAQPEGAGKPATDRPAAEDLATEEGKSLTEEGELLVPVEIVSKPILRDMELGIGYVSDDAYKFGRYNGLQKKGPFIIGDIDVEEFYEDGRFWNIHGTNLGLESRYLRIEGGLQGKYKLFLEYDELPNYKDNTVKSPFLGIGGDNLTLPPGFDINTNLDANLNTFEMETQRKKVKAGLSFIPKESWQFDVDASHENKQGVDATGSAIANTTGSMGNFITKF